MVQIICRTDPEYYDIVSQPIDLLKIHHKVRNEEYDDIDQLTQDIELMVNNAKAFYSVCLDFIITFGLQ